MRRFSQNQQEDKYNKDKLPLIFLEAWEQQILLVLFGRNQNPGLLLERERDIKGSSTNPSILCQATLQRLQLQRTNVCRGGVVKLLNKEKVIHQKHNNQPLNIVVNDTLIF